MPARRTPPRRASCPGRGRSWPARPTSERRGRSTCLLCASSLSSKVEREPQPEAVHLVVVLDARIGAADAPVPARVAGDQLDVKRVVKHVLDGGEPLVQPDLVDRIRRDAVLILG